MRSCVLHLHPGEVVEVRDERWIRTTLDESGTLAGLPFMPTMGVFCNKRFRVFRRADKIIVEGFGTRQMKDTVILEGATCEKGADGCQRSCFVLWKEAWLRRIKVNVGVGQKQESMHLNEVMSREDETPSFEGTVCQSRSLLGASSPISEWDIRRRLWDLTSGVYTRSELFWGIFPWFYNKAAKLLGDAGSQYRGRLTRTPTLSQDFQPGDLVKVKSKEEILRTLDRKGRNRGLEFTPEMEKYCGRTFSVMRRLNRMVVEQTGKMRPIANTVLLHEANCDGKAHLGCPRNCYCLWRDIWLEGVKIPVCRNSCF